MLAHVGPMCARVHAKSIGDGELEEMMAAFRDDTTLPKTTVVWKNEDGLSRERLILIRSCARLGRAEVVLGLLPFNLDSLLLCEELFLDALRGDKPTVSPPLSCFWRTWSREESC